MHFMLKIWIIIKCWANNAYVCGTSVKFLQVTFSVELYTAKQEESQLVNTPGSCFSFSTFHSQRGIKVLLMQQHKRAEIGSWTLLQLSTNTGIEDLLMAQRSSFPVRHLLSFIEWSSKTESDEITQAFLFTLHHHFSSRDITIIRKWVMQRLRTQTLYLPQYSKVSHCIIKSRCYWTTPVYKMKTWRQSVLPAVFRWMIKLFKHLILSNPTGQLTIIIIFE